MPLHSKSSSQPLNLGIDAFNIRAGGGLTHLREVLSVASPEAHGVGQVVLWGPSKTLDLVEDRPWLKKVAPKSLERGLAFRALWQQVLLPLGLVQEGCDCLFSPGGILPIRAGVPTFTLSQNMLPFESKEAARYPKGDPMRLKLKLLRFSQGGSFERADGVLFLTQYAHQRISSSLRNPPRRSAVVPHGVDRRFFRTPRRALPPSDYTSKRPFRVLYVSTVDFYKHQWQVAEAAAILRAAGFPISVDFVGTPYPPAADRLWGTLQRLDPQETFLKYEGALPFERLHARYAEADAFVFASSCENLPNILLEAMAAGLPIASSRLGPMPEILGDAGLYFDPESPEEIASAIKSLLLDSTLRDRLAGLAHFRAGAYSWERCANETFQFITQGTRDARQPH